MSPSSPFTDSLLWSVVQIPVLHYKIYLLFCSSNLGSCSNLHFVFCPVPFREVLHPSLFTSVRSTGINNSQLNNSRGKDECNVWRRSLDLSVKPGADICRKLVTRKRFTLRSCITFFGRYWTGNSGKRNVKYLKWDKRSLWLEKLQVGGGVKTKKKYIEMFPRKRTDLTRPVDKRTVQE